ncbi:MAG: transcriptional regulator GlxA family with amidase domain [Oceanospirillaceae bacterium]|jgi:transcriptional regulator GlxA family with amidase domain
MMKAEHSNHLEGTSEVINVYVLLLPDLLLLDMAGPVEVFNFANRSSGPQYRMHFIGPMPEIVSKIGLKLQVSPLPEELPKEQVSNWLLLPGLEGQSVDHSQLAIQQTIKWIDHHQQQFNKVISVCAGTLLLGYSKLLHHKQCTTHHSHLDELQQLVPSAKVLGNRLFVQDGNLYTSAGVTAGIDLALHIVEQVSGIACAANIAKSLVLFSRRTINDKAQSPWLTHRNHLHQGVHLIQDTLQSDPSRDWTMADLALIVHCSPRHLARLFKAHTKISCKSYLQGLRMSLAKQLLHEKTLSVEQVALKVGFNDVRQFRRIWQQYNDVLPSSIKMLSAAAER